jgi:hypothetical protein
MYFQITDNLEFLIFEKKKKITHCLHRLNNQKFSLIKNNMHK